ncbi:MAG: hypothetical protein MJ200_04875 [Mycoplasmoidaceae bacterium]|nr:hypothetical protein [Mycoplasmoidaceae bacterium]
MDNNGIGFSKADSYEEMSNKLRSYVPGNYTDCFINYDITQNPIVNFYVTVNAPIDENYRFTVYDEDYKPDYKN